MSGMQQPQGMMPGMQQPQGMIPGMQQPQGMIPGMQQPQGIMPGMQQPQGMMPGMQQPQGIMPGMQQPQGMMPGMQQPHMMMMPDMPEMEVDHGMESVMAATAMPQLTGGLLPPAAITEGAIGIGPDLPQSETFEEIKDLNSEEKLSTI